MIRFRTEVVLEKSLMHISHKDKTFFVGSCFTENIGKRFVKSGFETYINPFGTMYNPLSIAYCLERVAQKNLFLEQELVQIGGYWKSYSHHGDFRSPDKQECLDNINSALAEAHDFLSNASFVVLTLGTAWVYRLKENRQLLANCHKMPSGLIDRSLCKLEELEKGLRSAFEACRNLNPKVRFILTISPIRHWAEGYRDNMLSKSVLHLATEAFCSSTNSIYFPSYEIVMDDLRDYRFYATDMLHPNETAVEYIWEKFQETYFSQETIRIAKDFQRLDTMLSHRPFNPESPEYKFHLQKAENLRKELYDRIK